MEECESCERLSAELEQVIAERDEALHRVEMLEDRPYLRLVR